MKYNNGKNVIGRIRDLVCHYCGVAYRGHYESMYCSKECKVTAKKKGSTLADTVGRSSTAILTPAFVL